MKNAKQLIWIILAVALFFALSHSAHAGCPGGCGAPSEMCDGGPAGCDCCNPPAICQTNIYTGWGSCWTPPPQNCYLDCQGTCGQVGSCDCGTCPAPVCGDGACNNGETCTSCPADCGVCPPGPNAAACVSVNASASARIGDSFPISVYIKNIGTNIWVNASINPVNNYGLTTVPWPGPAPFGQQWISRPTIAPGAIGNFSGTATAPLTPGNYTFSAQMLQQNVAWFGEVCTKKIEVLDGCVIGGAYHYPGEQNVANFCQYCNPTSSRAAWSNKADNTACVDDGNVCTNDICTAGVCTHPAIACATCGNSIVEPGEQCDNGASNGACPAACSSSCKINSCPLTACAGAQGTIQVNCTYNVAGVSTAISNITQGAITKSCALLGWNGAVARFNCSTAALSPGAATVICSVDKSKSWQTSPDTTLPLNLNGPAGTCNGACLCGPTGACSCSATWIGNVTDSRSGQRVGVITPSIAATVRVDGGAYVAAPLGAISVPGLPFGRHNLSANATGYDPRTIFNVNFVADPTQQDIALSPIQCQPDCTYGGMCDFSCVGQNGCAMNGANATDINLIEQVCQYATPNSTRVFDPQHIVQCCTGPIFNNTQFQTPMTLASCARQGITQKVGVIVNGKPVQLTVISYDKCES